MNNTTNNTAVLIAGISLGVSLSTFLWRIIYDIYFDAPRVKVKFVMGGITSGPSFRPVYIITATNKGKHPTTLSNMHLCMGFPSRRWMHVFLSPIRQRLFPKREKFSMLMPDASLYAYMIDMPRKLLAGEEFSIYYGIEDTKNTLKANLPATLHARASTTHGFRFSRNLMKLRADT